MCQKKEEAREMPKVDVIWTVTRSCRGSITLRKGEELGEALQEIDDLILTDEYCEDGPVIEVIESVPAEEYDDLNR